MIKRLLKYLALAVSFFVLMSFTFIYYVLYSDLSFFKNIRELYVETAMTTMSHQYLATMFFSKDEIDRIMVKNTISVQLEKSCTYDVKIVPFDVKKEDDKNSIEIKNISGTGYKGKLMIVHDPARVKLAVSKKLLRSGEKLSRLISNENAIGGINASGFGDPEGKGNGGTPVGIVIKDGKAVFTDHSSHFNIIGFNRENILVLGRYKKDEINTLNLRDAVSFSPFLVINGKPQITEGDGGWGIQPRTAIGQTKDGKVLLLVIDGRQVSSIGITLKTLQEIMVENKAYNAANLDGGSSTVMYYEGSLLNRPCSKYGERFLPSAFVIK